MSVTRRAFLATVITVPALEFEQAWPHCDGDLVQVWIPDVADLLSGCGWLEGKNGKWRDGMFNLRKRQIDVFKPGGSFHIPLDYADMPLPRNWVRKKSPEK